MTTDFFLSSRHATLYVQLCFFFQLDKHEESIWMNRWWHKLSYVPMYGDSNTGTWFYKYLTNHAVRKIDATDDTHRWYIIRYNRSDRFSDFVAVNTVNTNSELFYEMNMFACNRKSIESVWLNWGNRRKWKKKIVPATTRLTQPVLSDRSSMYIISIGNILIKNGNHVAQSVCVCTFIVYFQSIYVLPLPCWRIMFTSSLHSKPCSHVSSQPRSVSMSNETNKQKRRE